MAIRRLTEKEFLKLAAKVAKLPEDNFHRRLFEARDDFPGLRLDIFWHIKPMEVLGMLKRREAGSVVPTAKQMREYRASPSNSWPKYLRRYCRGYKGQITAFAAAYELAPTMTPAEVKKTVLHLNAVLAVVTRRSRAETRTAKAA